jgi:hypothetical protein
MAADASARKPRLPVSPTLIVLGVILVLAVAALLVDRTARKGAEEAFEKLSERIPDVEAVEAGAAPTSLTQSDVKKLMGRAPDGPPTEKGNELVETFSWRGPLKRYEVFVVYRNAAEPLVVRATLNDRPR